MKVILAILFCLVMSLHSFAADTYSERFDSAVTSFAKLEDAKEEEEEDNNAIIGILNTGVTGFAFLMLLLTYRLASRVQTSILAHNPKDFPDIDRYREWISLMTSQLNNTRIFMVFSLLFFAGGLLLMMYQAESKIFLSVFPAESSLMTRVHHQDTLLALEEGPVGLRVKDEHTISVSVEPLAKEIRELSSSLEQQKAGTRIQTIDTANNSRDSGL